MYDIIIVGGGPAGLTAAIYAQRAGKSCLVLEKDVFGGNITESYNVENIPGFTSISGMDFAEQLYAQADKCGAELEYAKVIGIEKDYDNNWFVVTTEEATSLADGSDTFFAKAVIVATGTKHNVLGLENEDYFIGDGIHFCALCDGAFYKDKTVVVVGGGNSALTEALYLSDICKKVIIVQNLLTLTGDEVLIQRVEDKDNIHVYCDRVVTKYNYKEDEHGHLWLTGVDTMNSDKTKAMEFLCDGVFLCVGLSPVVPKSDAIITNKSGYAIPSMMFTGGLFVAGDCSYENAVKQVVTACADGATKATEACKFIDRQY